MVAKAFEAAVSPEPVGAVPGYGRVGLGDWIFLLDDADDSAVTFCGDFCHARQGERAICGGSLFHHQSVYECADLDCSNSFWAVVDRCVVAAGAGIFSGSAHQHARAWLAFRGEFYCRIFVDGCGIRARGLSAHALIFRLIAAPSPSPACEAQERSTGAGEFTRAKGREVIAAPKGAPSLSG